jgi:polyferredoxin
MAKKKSWIVWTRRIIQTFFLILFFYLVVQTTYHPINRTGGWVTFFFELDPLILLTSWICTHKIISSLLLSLVTLAATLIFGRWFCGWVCPFGALHNFFTSLRGGRLKEKMERGGYSRWQKAKHYFLAFFLVSAFLGFNLAGWLDPFSFFYRSTTIALYPSAQAAIQGVFGWIYQTDPALGGWRLTSISEPVYDVLRRYFLVLEQPHYFWSLLIGALFGLVVGLNFFRARFWCRYICPLGALLGVVGKNPALRLVKNEGACNDCRLCLPDCQGAAEPHSHGGWKPAECFYCWNCESKCPSEAISFHFEVPRKNKNEE